MIRHATLLAAVLACAALLPAPATPTQGQAGPPAPSKLQVQVHEQAFIINGERFELPFDRKRLLKVLGPPTRELDLGNRLLTWDDHGVFAFQQSNGTLIHAFAVALDRDTPDFWPKRSFSGTFTVDGTGSPAEPRSRTSTA